MTTVIFVINQKFRVKRRNVGPSTSPTPLKGAIVVERVRRLVVESDLDGLVARAARNETDLSFARAALAGGGGGHGGIISG